MVDEDIRQQNSRRYLRYDVLQRGNQRLQFLFHPHVDIHRGIILYFIDCQKPSDILILIFFSGRLRPDGCSCTVFHKLGYIFLIGLWLIAIRWIVLCSIGSYFIIHIAIILIVNTVPDDTGCYFLIPIARDSHSSLMRLALPITLNLPEDKTACDFTHRVFRNRERR